MPVQKQYLVLRDWDFSPHPSVVLAFKAGTVAQGLTRACVQAGIAARALKPKEIGDG